MWCALLGLVIGGTSLVAQAKVTQGDPGSRAAAFTADRDSDDEPATGESPVLPALEPNNWRGERLLDWPAPPPGAGWSIDYRTRWLFESRTSYEFGVPANEPTPYAPLSRLDWSLDSLWHGLQIARKGRNWELQFEWLAPQSAVCGTMDDYDWLNPASPNHLNSLSASALRWNDGQLLDLGGVYHLTNVEIEDVPIEIWPMAGFRFQRFDMVGHDGLQIIGDDPMIPAPGTLLPGDLITFNQQYYIGYLGGQLRSTLHLRHLPPITWTFQGDWGSTAGYNVDHHLFYEQLGAHRYTMESTWGGAMHLSLAAQMPVARWLTLGVQFDHTQIDTTGSHQMLIYDDFGNRMQQTWDNGVKVSSTQNSVTAMLRANF